MWQRGRGNWRRAVGGCAENSSSRGARCPRASQVTARREARRRRVRKQPAVARPAAKVALLGGPAGGGRAGWRCPSLPSADTTRKERHFSLRRPSDGFAERASPRWPHSWARTCCGLLRSAGRGAHWRRNIRLNGSAGAGRGSWMKATPTGSSTVAWRCWQAALEPVRPLIARAPSLVVGNIHRRSTQSQRPEGSIALCFAPLAASPPLRCPASLPARSIWPCNRPHTYRRIPRQARHSRTYPAPRPRYLACPESAYGDAFRATA